MIIRLIQKNPKRSTLLIKGMVFKQGNPTSCRVRAYNRSTGELSSETISKQDGSYVLFGARQRENYIIAVDSGAEFNIAAQDKVK